MLIKNEKGRLSGLALMETLQQQYNASKDDLRETFSYDASYRNYY